MAKPVCLPFVFLLILAMAFLIELVYAGGEGSLRPEQCQGACSYRCSKTHRRKACMLICIDCCQKCLCVPSGFYGHKEECPCYNNWKTKRGEPQVPLEIK